MYLCFNASGGTEDWRKQTASLAHQYGICVGATGDPVIGGARNCRGHGFEQDGNKQDSTARYKDWCGWNDPRYHWYLLNQCFPTLWWPLEPWDCQ